MFVLPLLLASAAPKRLYLSIKAPPNSSCTNQEGCGLQDLRNVLQSGDSIEFLDQIIQGEDAKHLISIINNSAATELTLSGKPTEISNPDLPKSDDPLISLENAHLMMQDITFKYVKDNLLSAMNTTLTFTRVSFLNAEVTMSPLMTLVNVTLIANGLDFSNSRCEDQMYIAGLGVTATINDFTFNGNTISTKNSQAAVHFLSSDITIIKGHVSKNVIKAPMFAVSNTSSLSIQKSFFEDNTVHTITYADEGSTTTLSSCKFEANTGKIVHGSSATVSVRDCQVNKQTASDVLFTLENTHLSIASLNISNSSVSGIVLNMVDGEYSTSVRSLSVYDLQTTMPIFAAKGGSVSISGLKVKQIISESDVLVLHHDSGIGTSVTDSKFTKMSARNSVATSVTVSDSSSVSFERLKFTKNDACGALFSNTSVSVLNSVFENNKCSPPGNTLPLAVLSGSLGSFVVKDSSFTNNTALTGSLFLTNTTASITQCMFTGNKAAQGTAVFSASTDLKIKGSKFLENSAMTIGGAVSIDAGSADIESCDFFNNIALEGGAIHANQVKAMTMEKIKSSGNKANNGTFLRLTGDKTRVHLINIEEDDDIQVAIVETGLNTLLYEQSRFSCAKKCKDVQNKRQTSFPWVFVSVPATFIVTVLFYRRYRYRKFRTLLPSSIRRGKHVND